MPLPPKQVGRPRLFENPDHLLDLFRDYLEESKVGEETPNIAGFRAYMGTSRKVINEYVQREEYSNAFEIMHDILEDKTINSRFADSQLKKLILQSKFDYSEKITSTSTNTNVSIDNKESEAILQRAFERIKAESKEIEPIPDDVNKV